MKSIFNTEAYQEILQRIDQLSPETKPEWGKMTVSQMLHHCQKALEVPLERSNLTAAPLPMRLVFKLFKSKMYDDSPWKHNLPTAKEFVVTEDKDFEKEKTYLTDLIKTFHHEKNRPSWPKHPSFGRFTNEQWGQMQYKHLDHHLTQFGV